MPKKDASKIRSKNQKIIVPKGTIDSRDDTIIEIPAVLQTQPIVIAKRKDGTRFPPIFDTPPMPFKNNCCTSMEPMSCEDTSLPPYQSSCFSGKPDIYNVYKPSSEIDLDDTELTEKQVVLKQLEEFQRARRRFLEDAAAVASKGSCGSVSSAHDKAIRWDSAKCTQTYDSDIPPPVPPRPKIRDSIMVAREHKGKFQNAPSTRSSRAFREDNTERRQCDEPNYPSSSAKNKYGCGNRDLESADIDALIAEAALDSESSEDSESFNPSMNSTLHNKKKDFNCDVCRTRPVHEILGSRRSRRGDKSSNPEKKYKTMEQKLSKTSEASEDVSADEFCPEDDCELGSKKSDLACAPCCNIKTTRKLGGKKSKSFMTDMDFEKIKDQLREARKRLDEAVAMVSRTVASSALSAGRMSPESDASSVSSSTGRASPERFSPRMMNLQEPRTFPELSPTTKSLHQPQTCPLASATGSTTGRSKSTTDNARCLARCSNVDTPPCVSNETPQKRSEEPRISPRRMVNPPNSSTIPCSLMFPCDIPSVTSDQDASRPPPKSTRSLPTASTRTDDNRKRTNGNDENLRRTDISPDANEDNVSRDDDKSENRDITDRRADMQSRSKDLNALCSTMCLDMDLPPCISEEVLKKKAEQLQNYLRKLSARKNPPTAPTSAPQLLPVTTSATSGPDVSRPPSPSMKSAATSTKIADMPPQRATSTPLELGEDGSNIKNNSESRSQDGGRMNQFRSSEKCSMVCFNLDPLCNELEEDSEKEPVVARSPRRSAKPSSTSIPCTPMYPCEIRSLTLKQDNEPSNDEYPPPNVLRSGSQSKEVRGPKIKAGEQKKKEAEIPIDTRVSLRKVNKKGKGGTISISTQTVETTITFVKSDFDDEDVADEEINNALNLAEVEQEKTKTSNSKRSKKNKK